MYIIEYEDNKALKEVASFDNLKDAKAFVGSLRIDTQYQAYEIKEVHKYLVVERLLCGFFRQQDIDEYKNSIVGVFDKKPTNLFLKALAARGLNKLKNNSRDYGKDVYGIYNSEGVYRAYCEYVEKQSLSEVYEYSVEERKVFVKKEVRIDM